MKKTLIPLALGFLTTHLAMAQSQWLDLAPKAGSANGKKVVIVTGDEEYRSEETGPMLGKILSQHHGFQVRVTFAIDPEGGFIYPNFLSNIPGLEALKDADLMVVDTRFRLLPDDQLAHIAAYLNAGKPVIGLRTATHAFNGDAATGDFKWADFGLKILGEKWVAHHGKHKVEGTRGVIVKEHADHPILNGVSDVFAYSDVYRVDNLDEKAATILMRGAVTESLEPDSKILDDPKNDPMQALVWLREYTAPDGKAKGKAFTTTMGAAIDFSCEDLRRLIVNAAFFLTGLDVPEKANATPVDPFDPTFYGFIREENYYQNLNLRPEDFGIGKSTATGLPEKMKRP